NVESRAELERIEAVARGKGVRAPISLRVNPDVDAQTHPYISTGLRENKFGIPLSEAKDLYRWALERNALDVHGVDCHIGSQIVSLGPFEAALERVFELVDSLAADGVTVKDVNVGGGLGIAYQGEDPPEAGAYVRSMLQILGEREATILVEPGRSISGHAGLLLTRVEYLKQNEARHFAVVDAAMNDFIRPALYDGWSEICSVVQASPDVPVRLYDVVGPVCESGDFIGKQRELALSSDALLAVMTTGAYGFVMSSNYNSRPRACEVMVDAEQMHLVRRRETTAELFAHESLMPSR
nr:diaminopimelate decarboxylase [Gammaproteobacteria bacterium]